MVISKENLEIFKSEEQLIQMTIVLGSFLKTGLTV